MMFLDEAQALIETRSLLAATNKAKLAVAFWGTSAIERLGLGRPGLHADILCNLDSGACNPTELRRFLGLTGVTLKSHPSLHAKVYWTASGAVVGSSNASTNGLAMDGDAAGGWLEANIRLTDSPLLTKIEAWFDTLFLAGYEIGEADLERAQSIWDARAGMAPTGHKLAPDLLTSYRNAPAHPAWNQVKLAYWRDPLSPEDEAWLTEEKAEKRLASSIFAYGQWNDRIAGNDWVLDFDLSGKSPTFGGIWKALPDAAGRDDLRLVYEVPHLHFSGFGRLRFGKKDAAPFGAISAAVLEKHSTDGGRNAVIDLATAVRLLDTPSAKPSDKAFTRAMQQIYDDAATIGYRPTTFRRMLAEHGGIETARRLIRGNATSGFQTLWEKQRLDLSVEALILQPEWLPLFSPEEHRIAKKRLQDYGYEFPA